MRIVFIGLLNINPRLGKLLILSSDIMSFITLFIQLVFLPYLLVWGRSREGFVEKGFDCFQLSVLLIESI